MTSLRVALVCPYDLDRPGGVQTQVRLLARELAQRGHVARVIGPGRGAPQVGEMRIGRFVTIGLSGTRIDLVVASRSELARVTAAAFDLVHLHTPWNPFLPLQVWAATPAAAHVATFHDAPPEGLWGALAGRVLMPLAGRLLSHALDEVTAVSEVAARSLPPNRATITPNGVDASVFAPTEIVGREPFILYVGRLEPRKGVDDLLEAYAPLEGETPFWRLVIAGDGPLAGTLRRRATHLRGVTLVGAVSEAEKVRLMQTCAAFCAPARAGESFGIVLLEAMASGAPVVAAANPGYAEVVGEDGLLFRSRDVSALRACLRRLRDTPTLAASLALRGRVRAERFTAASVTDTVEASYRHALARSAAPCRR